MKKSDIAMVILIASVSVMISFVVANQISFLKPPQKGEDVKTIEKINPTVASPDTNIFRADAINPTVQTVIGGGQSSQ